jgi:5,10-methylenetetrahydromethanopterin reductase
MEHVRAGPRCREAVILIKQLLAGEEVSYSSKALTLDRVKLALPARPSLAVYLAGRGPFILQAAGEVADGAIIGGFSSPAGLDFALDRVQQGAITSGRTLTDVDIIWWGSFHLTDDRASTIEALRPMVAHVIGGAPPQVLRIVGLADHRINLLKQAYSEGGRNKAAPLLMPEEVDLFTIIGDADECSARISRITDHGVNQVGMLVSDSKPELFLRRFAHEVMPRFR